MKKLLISGAMMAIFTLSVPLHARLLAVIGSGDVASQNGDPQKVSAPWTNLYMAYETLLNRGLGHDEITVHYGNDGTDFVSDYPEWDRFKNRWSNEILKITDYPNDSGSIHHVLDSLSGIMNTTDTLLYWWTVGDGFPCLVNPENEQCEYSFSLLNQAEAGRPEACEGTEGCPPQIYCTYIFSSKFASWVDEVPNAFRIFIWGTCYSGLMSTPLIKEPYTNKTLFLCSSNGSEPHFSLLLENTSFDYTGPTGYQPAWSAEFSYRFCSFADGCNYFGQAMNADRPADDPSHNNKIDFTEFHWSIWQAYSSGPTRDGDHPNSDFIPQLEDVGNKAPTTFLRDGWSRCLDIKYFGQNLARFSQAGYMQIKGTNVSEDPSGLIFKRISSGSSITTSGDLQSPSPTPYDHPWLDGSQSGNLVIRNNYGTAAIAAMHDDGSKVDIHLRGWLAPQYPRFNFQ
ncbi:MAG: hypothetical protein JW863_23960 [Chitinispirillaceae bacterium]|nr:hypothetical protein [Chitinispirillaceae bacterium]